jgi:tRNA (guanosine-2'-O-)-methyltransferase
MASDTGDGLAGSGAAGGPGDGAAGASAAGSAPRQMRPTDVKRLNREWRRRTEGRLALLLDSVSQPFNVGSIVRTAAAFGVESVWLCGNTPDLDLPAVGKTALGTHRFLTAYREPSAAAAAKSAAEDGFRVVAVELAGGALPLFEAPLDGDVCLAIGNEDHGCSPALLAAVSSVAYIPQVGRVGSLNVAELSCALDGRLPLSSAHDNCACGASCCYHGGVGRGRQHMPRGGTVRPCSRSAGD